jgi:hypothetical protein
MPKASSNDDDRHLIRIRFKGDGPSDSPDEEETDLSPSQ